MEALSRERIDAFVKQFPALVRPLRDAAYDEQGIWVKVYIRVKRADETLMFYRPEYADGERTSYGHESGGQCALRAIGYAVLRTGGIHALHADRHESFRMAQLLSEWGHRPDDFAHLMLVEIYDVYERASSHGKKRRFGREIEIVVFRPPIDGFEKLMKRIDPRLNVRLNLRDITLSTLRNELHYSDVPEQLDELAQCFGREFYMQGVNEMYAEGACGMSGGFENVKVRSLAFAGNILFTLQRGDDLVSFTCADSPAHSRMSVASISATLPVARELVQIVVDVWQTTPDKSTLYKHDPNMSVWKNLR